MFTSLEDLLALSLGSCLRRAESTKQVDAGDCSNAYMGWSVDTFLSHSPRHKLPIRADFSANKKDERVLIVMDWIPEGKALHIAGK